MLSSLWWNIFFYFNVFLKKKGTVSPTWWFYIIIIIFRNFYLKKDYPRKNGFFKNINIFVGEKITWKRNIKIIWKALIIKLSVWNWGLIRKIKYFIWFFHRSWCFKCNAGRLGEE